MQTSLIYVDDFEPEVFEPLVSAANQDQIPLDVHIRPNQPMAALEWLVLPAVALYFAKPFVDKLLAKASDDVAATVYPKFKLALHALVTRLYLKDRLRFKTFSSGKGKIVDEGAWLFGIYSVARSGKRIKFVFGDGLTAAQYATAVEELLKTLRAHHLDGVNDEIARGVALLLNPNMPDILLLFHAQKGKWEVIDPIARIQNRGKP